MCCFTAHGHCCKGETGRNCEWRCTVHREGEANVSLRHPSVVPFPVPLIRTRLLAMRAPPFGHKNTALPDGWTVYLLCFTHTPRALAAPLFRHASHHIRVMPTNHASHSMRQNQDHHQAFPIPRIGFPIPFPLLSAGLAFYNAFHFLPMISKIFFASVLVVPLTAFSTE